MELTTNASGTFHVLVAHPTTDEVKAEVLRGPARIINITRVAEQLTSVTIEASAGTVTLGLRAGSQSALNPAYAAVKLEVTAAPAAEFEASNLTISPKEVRVGEEVTVSVNVKNIGGAKDTYTVVLKVNGVVEASKDVTLAAGESTVVTFKAKRNIAGTYRVEVDGLADSFMVKAPRPAEFRFAELSISPAIAKRGETITITVKVTNVGDEAGNYTVELRIAGAVVDSRTVTLVGGESTTVTFEVSEHVGTYDVEVDGQKGTIIVEEAAPMPSPIGTWLPYIGAAVAIIAILAVAAFLARRRRIKASFGKAEVKESSHNHLPFSRMQDWLTFSPPTRRFASPRCFGLFAAFYGCFIRLL